MRPGSQPERQRHEKTTMKVMNKLLDALELLLNFPTAIAAGKWVNQDRLLERWLAAQNWMLTADDHCPVTRTHCFVLLSPHACKQTHRLALRPGRAAEEARRGRRTIGRRAKPVIERSSNGRIGRLWRLRRCGMRRHCRTGAAAEGARRWRRCARRGHRHLKETARIRRPLQVQALCAQLLAASATGSCASPNTLQLSRGSVRERLGEVVMIVMLWQ